MVQVLTLGMTKMLHILTPLQYLQGVMKIKRYST